jgi:hypothetical protein
MLQQPLQEGIEASAPRSRRFLWVRTDLLPNLLPKAGRGGDFRGRIAEVFHQLTDFYLPLRGFDNPALPGWTSRRCCDGPKRSAGFAAQAANNPTLSAKTPFVSSIKSPADILGAQGEDRGPPESKLPSPPMTDARFARLHLIPLFRHRVCWKSEGWELFADACPVNRRQVWPPVGATSH